MEQALNVLMAIQLIHGVNFALFWTAAVDAVVILSPPELANSCMASLNMIYFTLGGILGNSCAGYLFDLGGSLLLYYISAFILAFNVMIFQSYKGTLRFLESILS
jgi:hypothetical protein